MEEKLLDCPFCGGRPKVKYIGNSYTKTRKIELKCSGCRAKKINGAISNSLEWLENISIEDWNQRPEKANR